MTAKYYICFNDGQHWIKRFLKPGFGHCYVVKVTRRDAEFLDPGPRILVSNFLGWSIASTPPKFEDIMFPCGTKAIEVPGYCALTGNRKFFGWFNCVTLCKYFAGIDAPFVFTPYQLYRFLAKENAKCRVTQECKAR